MNQLKPYLLTLLIHPQVELDEKNDIEKLIRTWLEERGGNIKEIKTEEKHRVAYTIGHTQQVLLMNINFEFSGENLAELDGKLRRQKKVLRFRIFQTEPRGEGKTLKDATARNAVQKNEKEVASTIPAKEKAPIEKLDEKIEEILVEEVL
jgi:ribosomal protein S6